ncbi:uncharacterized protein LOC113295331 [Papaver somniferum]|uniref:uncharacterized protein LOC113295331 n=1 Tax=Papaver somniferum TaxID=3469 RepID=UPI000E6F7686|nr:uncharacterized protein LOC113295331 [Papaver somniferum]
MWKIENEDEEWTIFMRAKYKDKNSEWIKYLKQSSIGPGIKWIMSEMDEGSRWIVGDGRKVSVWNDKLIKDFALIERHVDDQFIKQRAELKVKDLIQNGQWKIPIPMLQYFDISEIPIQK